MKEVSMINNEMIESKILFIRGQKVMVDRDLAALYGVSTGRLNEQVERNIKRFPDDFMFKLTKMEADILISQFAISSSRSQIAILNKENGKSKPNLTSQIAILKNDGRGKNIKYLPYVFTEQGVAMLSGVLNSDKAIKVNIAIMRIFVNIRKFISSYEGLAMKIAELEKKYDKKIGEVFKIIDQLTKTKDKGRREIGFKG